MAKHHYAAGVTPAATAEPPGEAPPAGASSAAAAATEAANSLRQLLGLAACVLPLLDAAAASRLPSSHQHLTALLAVLRHKHPQLWPRMDTAVPIISGRHVTPSDPLADGQEIAFLLPIAGG